MDHWSIWLIAVVVGLIPTSDAAAKVEMTVDCSVNTSLILPIGFTYCILDDIDVITEEDMNFTSIDMESKQYFCGTEFRNVTWQANYSAVGRCNVTITQNFSRILAIEPIPPSFAQPHPMVDIQRTTLESLDPLHNEKPTAQAKCQSNLVYVAWTDDPAVKVGCGRWTIRRTWSLHIISLLKSDSCVPPSGGLWDSNVFVQTITLVDNRPPEIYPIESTPGAYPKPRLAQPTPAVHQCDQSVSPMPPQYFAHPDCALSTQVHLVQQNNIAPTTISNRVCGAQFFENVWQAAYSNPCSGSSGTKRQLVTLLPAPPVLNSVPGPVSITTSDSLSPDQLGYAVGASPCGHDVDVTFADEPPVRVACGKWTITRVWTVALHFDDTGCTLPERYTATATQLITITDVSAPAWVHRPPAEVRIPFFTNYHSERSIPSATETGHQDMIQLGLTSYPVKLHYQDNTPVMLQATSDDSCAHGLASMQREWTISDRCGNSDSVMQTLIIEHPPKTLQTVSQWDPIQQWYPLAPGVEQLIDACAAGKRIVGTSKEFYLTDATGLVNSGCEGEGAWAAAGCQETGEEIQDYYTQDIHSLPPYFPADGFPPSATIDTTASLDPSVNTMLGTPTGASPCGTPFTISYHDAPPVQQGCGVWTIQRTWKIQPHYADCGGAEANYPDALTQRKVQVITIHDVTAPEWVHVPPPEVQVPFFENYQEANPIPLARETAHADMLALGLVSNPVKVKSQDTALTITDIGPARCEQGLASFGRRWTTMDACGNSQSYVQRIVLQHPPTTPAPTQPWRPADAGLASADRDITGPNRLFAYSPGVEQLADACYPGKRVVGNGAVFTGLGEADHNCSAGRWTETACRLEEQKEGGGSGVSVHAWPPFFVTFPSNVTIFTDHSLDLEGPSGGSYCNDPFTISHHDAPPVQRSCGVWTIARTWKIQPFYLECGGADAKYADALTTTKVQVITVMDAFPPQFISHPPQDIFVEFLEDYGPIATGIPLIEDKATSPDMAALRLISYPIALRYDDIDVKFFTGATSHVQGMAVVSRQWTTQDACGNMATWLQTIRVRNPNAKGNAGPLGIIGNFTVFATEEVHIQFTNFSGSVGSNSKIFLTDTQPMEISPDISPYQEFPISHFSEKLLSHYNRLFIDKLSACTGLRALNCTQPEQYTCQATLMTTPTTTTVSYDQAGNMILQGDGLLYNIFNDVDVDDWRYTPPKVTPPTSPKQIIRAEGFVIINIIYNSLDASRTMLRETIFEQRFPAGDPFVLYNLKNIPEQPTQNMAFSNTNLTGSLISQDAWNEIIFENTVVTGQVVADHKRLSITSCVFNGRIFTPNYRSF